MSLFEDLHSLLNLHKANDFKELAKAKNDLIDKIKNIGSPCSDSPMYDLLIDFHKEVGGCEELLNTFKIDIEKEPDFRVRNSFCDYYDLSMDVYMCGDSFGFKSRITHSWSDGTEYDSTHYFNGYRFDMKDFDPNELHGHPKVCQFYRSLLIDDEESMSDNYYSYTLEEFADDGVNISTPLWYKPPIYRVEYQEVYDMLEEFVKKKGKHLEYLLDEFEIYLVKKERYGCEKTYYIDMIINGELINIQAKRTNVEDHSGSTDYDVEISHNGKKYTYSWDPENDLSDWSLDKNIRKFLSWSKEYLVYATISDEIGSRYEWCDDLYTSDEESDDEIIELEKISNIESELIHSNNELSNKEIKIKKLCVIDEFDKTINFI